MGGEGNAVDIVVTATPVTAGIIGAPRDLVATYVSDNQVALDWTMGTSAANTTIMARFGEAPHDINDGYLVFDGQGTSANDTIINFDVWEGNDFLDAVYYRAWSRGYSGRISDDYAEASLENPYMAVIAANFPILILIGVLTLLTALAFWQRHIFIYLIVAAGDIVFGLYFAFHTDPFLNASTAYSATWVVGVIIVCIGVFMLYRVVMKLVRG
jgi:hypothetical protein